MYGSLIFGKSKEFHKQSFLQKIVEIVAHLFHLKFHIG